MTIHDRRLGPSQEIRRDELGIADMQYAPQFVFLRARSQTRQQCRERWARSVKGYRQVDHRDVGDGYADRHAYRVQRGELCSALRRAPEELTGELALELREDQLDGVCGTRGCWDDVVGDGSSCQIQL